MTTHPVFAQILRDIEDMHSRVERARVKPEDNTDDLAEPLPVVLGPNPISQSNEE